MKLTVFLAALTLALFTGCAGPEKRVKVARFDGDTRPAAARVEVIQAGASVTRPHHAIALLTAEGHAHEEAECVEGMIVRCRQLGADALVILEADAPNANIRFRGGLAGPRPSYRIFRGNAVVWD